MENLFIRLIIVLQILGCHPIKVTKVVLYGVVQPKEFIIYLVRLSYIICLFLHTCYDYGNINLVTCLLINS